MQYRTTVPAVIGVLSSTVLGQTNPVKLDGKPQLLGNVTSANTNEVRDLGFQGNIGDMYINTFGDTIPNPCIPGGPQPCGIPNVRNSGGLATDDVLSYNDLNVTNGQSSLFVQHLYDQGETDSNGLGITNVIQTGDNAGIIYCLPLYSNNSIRGASWATVDTSSGQPVTTRTQLNYWESDEYWYGDSSALHDKDGHIYILGSSNYGGKGLARVPLESATDFNAYQYWNGQSWQKERIRNVDSSSAVLAAGTAGQGTLFYSEFYEQYLYFTAATEDVVSVLSAPKITGPWADGVNIWTSDDNPDQPIHYTPVVQPKYTDPEGKYVVLYFTSQGPNGKEGNIIQALNVTFTGGSNSTAMLTERGRAGLSMPKLFEA